MENFCGRTQRRATARGQPQHARHRRAADVETGTPEQLKMLVPKEAVRRKSVVTAAKIKAD